MVFPAGYPGNNFFNYSLSDRPSLLVAQARLRMAGSRDAAAAARDLAGSLDLCAALEGNGQVWHYRVSIERRNNVYQELTWWSREIPLTRRQTEQTAGGAAIASVRSGGPLAKHVPPRC